MLKKIISFVCASIFVFSTFSFIGCGHTPNVQAEGIKNVILFIGDGMGENHIANMLTYFGLKEPNFFANRVGSVATKSANNAVTDSAAAATAMATGQKVNNYSVAMHKGENLKSISELALSAGKKVGVVTTDKLNGATPAAFSSHARDRQEGHAITKGQAKSGIHLLMGESDDTFYRSYEEDFIENGYDVVNSSMDLQSATNSEKIFATLPNIRSEYATGCEDHFQLMEMLTFAMDFLENDNGYFLMIESAQIDKFSHSNYVVPALCEVRSMFDCVSYLYENLPNDTALIVTADHESGGLQKAENAEEIVNTLYTTREHTSANVPLYIKNFTYKPNGTPQNTEIFQICKKLLGI